MPTHSTQTQSTSFKAFTAASPKQLWRKLQGRSPSALLSRGAIGVFVVQVAGAGLLFALHVMLARLLGVEQYGMYIYEITWVNILAILCLLGFQTSLVRFVPACKANRQWELLSGILKRSTDIVLIFSLTMTTVGMSMMLAVRHRISVDQLLTYSYALVLLPLFVLAPMKKSGSTTSKRFSQCSASANPTNKSYAHAAQ